jgi:hypothetical protein
MVAGMGIGKTIAHKLQRRPRAAIQAFAKANNLSAVVHNPDCE